jgi:type IX secretion system PorP/SprF family membrane protein
MAKYLLFLPCILLSVTVGAQQQAVYSNFLFNDYYYSPAVAGSKANAVISVGYRNQWTGFSGSPVNMNAAFYGSVKNKGKHGYGVSVINEKIGITNKTGFYLNYAYHIRFSEQWKLGLGVRPGYVFYGVKLYDAQVADQGDAVLTGNIYGTNAFDVATGFNLYSRRFFLMGSLNHLLGENSGLSGYNSSLAFHYNLMAGYRILFPKKRFELQPAIMVKHVRPVPAQWTAMVKGAWNNRFWAALIYRSDDAAGVSVGITLRDRLTIGYGYDYAIGGLRTFQSGSHEVMLSFTLPDKRPTLDEDDDELNKSIMDKIQEDERRKKEEEEKNTLNPEPASDPDNRQL